MASHVEPEITANKTSGFLYGLKKIPIAASFSFFLAVYVAWRAIDSNAQVASVLAATLVAIGSFIGFIAGGATARRVDRAIDAETKKRGGSRLIQSLDSEHDARYDNFLTFSAIIAGLYIAMYFETFKSFQVGPDAPLGLPVSPFIILITSITIFFMDFFSVRYASYVRMTKCLEIIIRDTGGVERSVDDRAVIGSIRDGVFRDSQLYEPAGNVFVTIGITATFLGLAVALIGLDLPGLVTSGARSTASLSAFVACMGLALGVSMLGVMTALAAQWLRGYGAGEGTEDLLVRADKCLVLEKTGGVEIDDVESGPTS